LLATDTGRSGRIDGWPDLTPVLLGFDTDHRAGSFFINAGRCPEFSTTAPRSGQDVNDLSIAADTCGEHKGVQRCFRRIAVQERTVQSLIKDSVYRAAWNGDAI